MNKNVKYVKHSKCMDKDSQNNTINHIFVALKDYNIYVSAEKAATNMYGLLKYFSA